MRHALHGANHCPSPLDPELQCKLQLVAPWIDATGYQNILSLRAIAHNGVAIPIDFREKSANLKGIATPARTLVRDDMRFG